MARQNKTQFAILGCLLIKPMSAYEMKQFMAKSTSNFWREREGQLYPTLTRLSEQRWVSAKEEPAAKIGTKKIYSITSQGKKAFQEWFQSSTELPVERNEFLLKLFFARSQSKQAVTQLLKEAITKLNEELEELIPIQTILKNKRQSGIDTTFYELTLDYGIMRGKAELAWYQKALNKVKKKS